MKILFRMSEKGNCLSLPLIIVHGFFLEEWIKVIGSMFLFLKKINK